MICARIARYWRVLVALLPARVDRAHAHTISQEAQVFSYAPELIHKELADDHVPTG